MLRGLPFAICTIVAGLWLWSFSPLWLGQAHQDGDAFNQVESTAVAPNWRDALLITIAITDTAIQQQRGVAQWQVGERIARTPLTVLADGRRQNIVLPIGLHPDWIAGAQTPAITFPRQNEQRISAQLHLITRSPFALDALLGRMLTPLIIALPAFDALVRLAALLVVICLALTVPVTGGATRLRLVIWAVVGVCVAASLGAAIAQVRLTPLLWQRYAGMDEWALARSAPHYADSAQINDLLVEAARALPAGEVLVFDPGPATSYFKARAFYLLYPRWVSFAPSRPGRLPSSVVGVIQPATGQPPAPGWIPAAGPLAGLEAWRSPIGDLPIPAPSAGFCRILWAMLALAAVILAGFGVGGALGWRGLRRWASALSFGAGLTAWWMTILSLASIPWTPASIGLPLAMVGGGLTAFAWRKPDDAAVPQPHISSLLRPRRRIGPALAIAMIGLLFVCVTVQAGLLPFTDQDSWTTWGYNSRALFVEGSVLSFLARHGVSEMNHPSYPPGLPLLNAWVYLALGEVNEQLVKLAMPLWWLSLMGLIWNEARRLRSVWLATGLTLLAATTPIFLDHAALSNADLPFTVALTVAVCALTRWIVAGAQKELAGGVLSLGVAAWLKLDGIYLGLAFLACAALARGLHLHLCGNDSRRRLVGHSAIAMLALIVVYAPWMWLAAVADVAAEAPATAMLSVTGLSNLEQGLRVLFSELLLSYNNSTWSLLGAGYLLFWPMCAALIVVQGWKARRNAPFLFLVATTMVTLLFYTLIYVMRPFFSIERYVMHAAPLALLAAIHALRDESVDAA